MKIAAIKSYAFKVGIRNQPLVRVETDEGIFGRGESGLSGRERAVVSALVRSGEEILTPSRTDVNSRILTANRLVREL